LALCHLAETIAGSIAAAVDRVDNFIDQQKAKVASWIK
jgi:hypothetical protein